MEQRRLRLGDILDDYCPRERRLTNHAVVAMVEDTVKQTRCTTCDAEHPYKGGQAPKRKRKDAPAPAALASSAPDVPAPLAAVVPAAPAMLDAPGDEFQDDLPSDVAARSEPVAQEYLADTAPTEDDAEPNPPAIEDGPVHRPLIRATLPRPEGQKDARTPPDFTVRQAGGRGGNVGGNQQFRGGGGGNRGRQRIGQGGNGHRTFGGNAPGNSFGGPRFGARPGPGQGQGQNRGQGGFRSAQQPRQGQGQGGRKRSR